MRGKSTRPKRNQVWMHARGGGENFTILDVHDGKVFYRTHIDNAGWFCNSWNQDFFESQAEQGEIKLVSTGEEQEPSTENKTWDDPRVSMLRWFEGKGVTVRRTYYGELDGSLIPKREDGLVWTVMDDPWPQNSISFRLQDISKLTLEGDYLEIELY